VKGTELEVTHINNNDGTIEGLRHKKYPAFSVQYHPEAAPGPFDSSYLFDDFLTMIRAYQAQRPQSPKQAQRLAEANAARGAKQAGKGDLQYAQK
jgi:carbamoyl-phosphate synthase small subunit